MSGIQYGTLANLNDSIFDTFRSKSLGLTVEYYRILWEYRIVVPEKVRSQLLQELYRSHLGIVKTKGLDRSYIWWPKIDTGIENFIKNGVSWQ